MTLPTILRRSERVKVLNKSTVIILGIYKIVQATQKYGTPPQMLSFASGISLTIQACYCRGPKNLHIPAAEHKILFG